MTLLDRLHTSIAAGKLLNENMLRTLSLPLSLNNRETDPFDSAWMRVFEEIRNRLARKPLDAEEQRRVDEIRETVYRRVYDATHDPDAAAYASDDFDLIATALLIGYDDEWLNSLWLAYKTGRFPSGVLVPVPGSLEQLLDV